METLLCDIWLTIAIGELCPLGVRSGVSGARGIDGKTLGPLMAAWGSPLRANASPLTSIGHKYRRLSRVLTITYPQRFYLVFNSINKDEVGHGLSSRRW